MEPLSFGIGFQIAALGVFEFELNG